VRISFRAVALLCSLWSCAGFAVPPAQAASAAPSSAPAAGEINIPGPLRSFLRMAGISQKISKRDVMPLLSRNIYMQGYEGGNRPTEFLILLNRYVQQARQLSDFAGGSEVIKVTNCDQAKNLLHILGYRMRDDCGKPDTALETADAERAFLTTDSGFPLAALEQDLQQGKPFEYPYAASRVPLLFSESDWMSAGNKREQQYSKDLLDVLLHNPSMARLYWAFSRLDPETRTTLQQTLGIRKLVPHAAALDFYGYYLCIRSGKVLVPGGDSAEQAWSGLVGASPRSPGEFVDNLLSKDTGWLAAYFDVLSRISTDQQAHFTHGSRLHTLYEALHTNDPALSATRGAFRPAPGLLLLATRQQWEPDGAPRIPGNLQLWKEILRQKSDSKLVREWGKRAGRLSSPDQLLQTMVALSRANTEFGPLQMYLVLGELDARRKTPLKPETVLLLARKFELFSDQYRLFAEFPELSDSSIALFLETANALDHIDGLPLRGNALGTLQANLGIWQIVVRQGQISTKQINDSWQGVLEPFSRIHSSADLYTAGRSSFAAILRSATGKSRASQDEIIEMLAGPPQADPAARKVHEEIAARMRSVLDSQRLVSLDTLNALGDGLKERVQGKPLDPSMNFLAEQLREFEMPRPIFKASERSEWAAGIYNNSHTDAEMRTDLSKALGGQPSRNQLEDALGQLSSFQRDTLVGLNYAYYEPPGAQVLHNNPLLVRNHDFSAESVGGIRAVWQAPHLFGEGSPAGGGAHLVGSLADLPFALAEIEQDFMVPENVQALIWRELVPGLVTSAILPRWWGVSRTELHAISLYQRTGEELVKAAGDPKNAEFRNQVMSILSERMSPQVAQRIENLLSTSNADAIVAQLAPADTFYLAADFRRKYPDSHGAWGTAGEELDNLCKSSSDEVGWARLSHDFGVPHPVLAQTYGRELLNLPPVPAFAGYSSRLLAESWDSGTLYWARLADEGGFGPEALNRMVPELTRRMVEKVFATDFEDWPALVRALHETGDEYRRGKDASVSASANDHLSPVGSAVGGNGDKR
jgi:hypothetical protein